jgi:hypothetical protein
LQNSPAQGSGEDKEEATARDTGHQREMGLNVQARKAEREQIEKLFGEETAKKGTKEGQSAKKQDTRHPAGAGAGGMESEAGRRLEQVIRRIESERRGSGGMSAGPWRDDPNRMLKRRDW